MLSLNPLELNPLETCKVKVGDLVGFRHSTRNKGKGIVIDLDIDGDPVVFWFVEGKCRIHFHIQLMIYSTV